MVAEERPADPVGDPIARLAVLLEEWRLKPARNARWLQELCLAFAQQEPAAWARFDRISALGSEIASLLDLSPWSRAALRCSALLSALARLAKEERKPRELKRNGARGWEDKLRGWRWLETSALVLDGLRPGYDTRQPLARVRKEASTEVRVLALAEDFVDLTAEETGAPRNRIPQALNLLRSGHTRRHDPKLVDLLWSEKGQAALDRLLRRRGLPDGAVFTELRAAVRLLDKAPPPPMVVGRRHESPEEPWAETPAPEAPSEPEATVESPQPVEEVKRGEKMKTTTAKAVWSIETGARPLPEAPASLAERVASAVRELEEIKAAAARSQEALAAILPAMDELSEIVARLQASLSRVQDSPRPLVVEEAGDLQPVVLRIELPQSSLNVGELVSVLAGLPDFQELHVRDRGATWVVLHAKTVAHADLTLLEAKVTGALARYAGETDSDESVKVTVLEAE